MSEILIIDKYRKYDRRKMSRRAGRESGFHRLLLLLVLLLSLFLAGELIFHFLIAPRLTVRNIVIRSDLPLSREEVLALAGAEKEVFYYDLDAGRIKEALERLPMVRRAEVEKVFPDALNITLYGREPLSLLFFTTPEGASVPLLIDDQGVVFEIGSTLGEWDLPVITGIEFRTLEVGARLPEVVQPMLRQLNELRRKDEDVFRLISELRLIPKAVGPPEILLYPIHHPVRLRLSADLDPSVLRNAFVVMDLLQGQGLLDRVKELDMRTGEVVYRIEEE